MNSFLQVVYYQRKNSLLQTTLIGNFGVAVYGVYCTNREYVVATNFQAVQLGTYLVV